MLGDALVFAFLVAEFNGVALVVVLFAFTEGDDELDMIALRQ